MNLPPLPSIPFPYQFEPCRHAFFPFSLSLQLEVAHVQPRTLPIALFPFSLSIGTLPSCLLPLFLIIWNLAPLSSSPFTYRLVPCPFPSFPFPYELEPCPLTFFFLSLSIGTVPPCILPLVLINWNLGPLPSSPFPYQLELVYVLVRVLGFLDPEFSNP